MARGRNVDSGNGSRLGDNRSRAQQDQDLHNRSNGRESFQGCPVGQPVIEETNNANIIDRNALITKHRQDNGRTILDNGQCGLDKMGSKTNPSLEDTGAGPHRAHKNDYNFIHPSLKGDFHFDAAAADASHKPHAHAHAHAQEPYYDQVSEISPVDFNKPTKQQDATRITASSNLHYAKGRDNYNSNYEMDAVDGSTYDRSDQPSRRTETTRTTDATSSNLHQTRNLYTEADRLSTYFDWPRDAPVSPEDLARQGFFYLGYRDRVECAFCGGVLHQWEAGNDPFIEHERHYPHCPFVNGEATANVQLGATSPQAFQPRSNPGTAQAISPSHQLPGTPALVTPGQIEPRMTGNTSAFALPVETQWPRMPDFADEDSRLSTFHNWPRYSPISPLRLARAGFIYTYVADHVRCYWCEGGLKDWQQDDDPWEEHARWYGPECGYVIMSKGMDYIRDIRTRRPPVVQQPQFRWGVETGIIQSALEMGFDEDRIQAVIHNQWQRHNRPFTSAAELLNALLPQEEVPFYPPPNEEEEPPFTFQNAPPVYRPPPAPEPVNEQPLDPETMERELRRLREERQCKVCLSEDACMVFIPCGHLCCCEHCANMLRIRGRRCPLCRAMFQRVQRAFLA